MKRILDIYWPFFGSFLFIPFYFGLLKIPEINLQVISILFSGLLALLLILPAIEGFGQIKKIKNTGHLNDLIYYIRFPLSLSIFFIIIEFFSSSILFHIDSKILLLGQSIYMGLWGIFFLALIRLIALIPHLVYNKSPDV